MIGAVIFDCDGVLVNSESIAQEVESEILSAIGLDYDRHEFTERFMGMSDSAFFAALEADGQARLGRSIVAEIRGPMNERYRKHTFKVQGEVVGFEKPLFTRDYKLLLKTANRQIKVICDIVPPEKYSAVFTIKNGSELVGLLAGQTRVPITKVGDTVVLEGQCKGMSDSVVKMSSCELKSVQ